MAASVVSGGWFPPGPFPNRDVRLPLHPVIRLSTSLAVRLTSAVVGHTVGIAGRSTGGGSPALLDSRTGSCRALGSPATRGVVGTDRRHSSTRGTAGQGVTARHRRGLVGLLGRAGRFDAHVACDRNALGREP